MVLQPRVRGTCGQIASKSLCAAAEPPLLLRPLTPRSIATSALGLEATPTATAAQPATAAGAAYVETGGQTQQPAPPPLQLLFLCTNPQASLLLIVLLVLAPHQLVLGKQRRRATKEQDQGTLAPGFVSLLLFLRRQYFLLRALARKTRLSIARIQSGHVRLLNTSLTANPDDNMLVVGKRPALVEGIASVRRTGPCCVTSCAGALTKL